MMKSNISLIGAATILGIGLTTGSAQAYTIFFGEDLGLGELTRLTSTPNADAARNNFLANLVGVGTENFESFTPGTTSPLSLTFPGAGNATLNGGGLISSVPTGTNGVGRYPISGNQYWETSSNFFIDFEESIAAFGFYGIDIGDFNGQVTITLASGTNQTFNVGNTINAPGGSVLYFGIIAENENETFTSLSFGNTASGTDFFGFDDMTIGSIQQVQPPQSTPEPASLLGLLAVGALGASSTLKRKQKQLAE
jgi:hypothetical protein